MSEKENESDWEKKMDIELDWYRNAPETWTIRSFWRDFQSKYGQDSLRSLIWHWFIDAYIRINHVNIAQLTKEQKYEYERWFAARFQAIEEILKRGAYD
ncbi:MAG: hypothetical protein M1344_02645 [Candidatus Thermoplasmatota archaeon]|jgi:hypothetical protein|nr:hypothetical protein [Candidatus Thermoplasmatota archaeon]